MNIKRFIKIENKKGSMFSRKFVTLGIVFIFYQVVMVLLTAPMIMRWEFEMMLSRQQLTTKS